MMHRLFSLLLIALITLSTDALADKGRHKRRSDSSGKTNGVCQFGVASTELDINNVRARLFNTGGLFYKPQFSGYVVPIAGSANSLAGAGIWISGWIDGELAMSGSDYGFELWPGPLDDNGDPPNDCSKFDRMYKVDRQDILDYEDTGVATSDLEHWPGELGAPVIDGDSNPNNYDLTAGDRPDVLGDQTIWWVMNDLGNVHEWYGGLPLGIEIQATAFAFKRADALNNTTFYRYKVLNKGGNLVEQTYFSIFVDADLGNSDDDYVGSDTTLGLGYAWNGDNFDETLVGYGDLPPAIGVDFFEGPLVDADGVDNDNDGEIDEDGESLAMTSFVYFNLSPGPQGDPYTAEEANRYQRSIWKDNIPITFGGTGRGFSDEPASFMYPGEPDEYWSEHDSDSTGTSNAPGDRRFLVTSGPFTLEPGAEQTITFGIVWAQGEDRFDSVRKLKDADRLAQTAFDVDFRLAPPPDPPRVEVSELDETVVLKWGYQPSDNNYLDQYEVENPFLNDLDPDDDKTYNFEGYIIHQFHSEADQEGEIVATFDVVNGITRVVDIVDATTNIPIADVAADGTDSGVEHSIQFDDLNNYTDYYFGVQAYAYNENSAPLIVKSAISRVVVRPSKQLARQGGTVINPEASTADFTLDNGLVRADGLGGGFVEARVVDPSVLTGHMYRVEFFEENLSDDPDQPNPVTNYHLIDATANKMVLDGSTAVGSFGNVVPQGNDVFVADGLSWTVDGPVPDVLIIEQCIESPAFVQVQGIGDDDACGPAARSRCGCAEVGGNMVYNGSVNGTREWAMHHEGPGPEGVIGSFSPNDYEIRATEAGSYAYHNFTTGNAIWVPFEIWDVGLVGAHGTNDPADDVQMIPVIFSPNEGECFFGFGETENDPFGRGWPVTDRIYAYYPVNDDYGAWEAAIKPLVEADAGGCPTSPETDVLWDLIDFDRGRPIQRIVFFMDSTSTNYRHEFIPIGNVIRFLTTKPNIPGDVFTVDTEGYGVEHDSLSAVKEALDLIAVVPNPYKGVSDYEINNLADVVRFTNMPEEATIRIFTLAGTLIKTIFKSSPGTSIEWDLRTQSGLPIGSGMYLIHVEVPGVGAKVIKFGAVKKRQHLELY